MYCAIVAHDYLHSRVRVVFYLHLVYAILSCDYMDVSSLKVGVVVLIATGEDGRERNKDAGKIPKAGPGKAPILWKRCPTEEHGTFEPKAGEKVEGKVKMKKC